MGNKDALRLPVVSLAAEHLAIGLLMRRNIMAYKAPPNNQGYALVCIHPDPSNSNERVVHVQVKSRYQTDSDRAFPIKDKTFGSFEYLMIVFLNIGYFYSKSGKDGGDQSLEVFTIPKAIIESNHYAPKSGFQKVRTKGMDIECFRGGLGIEQIAKDLGVSYPSRPPVPEKVIA